MPVLSFPWISISLWKWNDTFPIFIRKWNYKSHLECYKNSSTLGSWLEKTTHYSVHRVKFEKSVDFGVVKSLNQTFPFGLQSSKGSYFPWEYHFRCCRGTWYRSGKTGKGLDARESSQEMEMMTQQIHGRWWKGRPSPRARELHTWFSYMRIRNWFANSNHVRTIIITYGW